MAAAGRRESGADGTLSRLNPGPQRATEQHETIAVAMSGGVDSSVAAALLVDSGLPVVGIMLKPWSEPGVAEANRCCTPAAIDDARAVADALGIPFTVLDIQSDFKRDIVDRYVDRAAGGATPNPCFECNSQIRFGLLLRQALALGAGKLATGHYARVTARNDGRYSLHRGVDPSKDQSYVLHALGQSELRHAVFPLGDKTKPEVRALAVEFGLPVAARPDSVDLCWVGEGGVSGFLGRHLPPDAARPGPIEDTSGRVVGRHAGLPLYTLGQRRGLGVALGHPTYVVDRDEARNALVIGDDSALLRQDVYVADFRWIAGEAPRGPWPLRAEAQVRYRAIAAPASVTLREQGGIAIRFDSPVRAPTPGQGLVVYSGDEVLGGGIIASTA